MKTNGTLAYTQCKTIFLTFIAKHISPFQTLTSFGRLLFISRRYSHNIRKVKPRNAFPERAVIIFNSLQQTKWICVVDVHYSFVPIMGKGEKLVYYNTSHTFV